MKKIGILLTVMALLMGSLMGCNSTSGNSSTNVSGGGEKKGSTSKDSSDKGSEDSETITLARWGNELQIDGLDQTLSIWKEDHPNVNVEYTYTGGDDYPVKLQVWFSSDSCPDVLRNTSDIMYPFLNNGLFYDLTDYFEKDPDLSRDMWSDNVFSRYELEEGLIGIPVTQQAYCIAYNKDVFDKAGVAYPESDWTESEFLDLCKKLTFGKGVDKIYGLWMGGWVSEYVRCIYGEPLLYDADKLVIQAKDNERFRDALEMFGSLLKDGYCPNEINQTQTSGGFVTGQYAMGIVPTRATFAEFQTAIGKSFDWDVVELPYSEKWETTWNPNIRVNGWSASAKTKYPDTAWDLIKFLCTDTRALDADSTAGVPVLKSYIESDNYANNYYGYEDTGVKFDKSVAVHMADFAQPYEFAGFWSEINDNIKVTMDSYVRGDIDLDSAIDNLQTFGESAIAKHKKEKGISN